MDSNSVIQPRLLKDFLYDQTLTLPRHRKSTIAVFIHAAVSSVKSKLIRRNRRRSPEIAMTRTTSVTVKDILRWRSFRDVAEENDAPMAATDFVVVSPSRCTTTTTATATTTPRSSWCDSDFTVGDSPVWCRGFSGDVEVGGKKNFRINVAGGDKIRAIAGTTRDPKDQLLYDEEQYSPISVLDFQSQDDEKETSTSFNQTLTNMERRNFLLKQRIQEFENLIKLEDHCSTSTSVELDVEETCQVKEKAVQLMNMIKETSMTEACEANVDFLLLDFFMDELIMGRELKKQDQLESKLLQMANAWMIGEDDGSLRWDMEGTKDICIKDMDMSGSWKSFDLDRQELGIEIEAMVLDSLLDEL